MADSPPTYQAIANRLRAAIRRGDLAPGAKMPSVRRLAEIEQVSAPTAEHALRVLEASGQGQASTFARTCPPSRWPRNPAPRPGR